MFVCKDCHPTDPTVDHVDDDREVLSCNWLDWMIADGTCPHCAGPVEWFKPAPAGQFMDAFFDDPRFE